MTRRYTKKDPAILALGTLSAPLWIVGFLAYLIYYGLTVGWTLGQVAYEWAVNEGEHEHRNRTQRW